MQEYWTPYGNIHSSKATSGATSLLHRRAREKDVTANTIRQRTNGDCHVMTRLTQTFLLWWRWTREAYYWACREKLGLTVQECPDITDLKQLDDSYAYLRVKCCHFSRHYQFSLSSGQSEKFMSLILSFAGSSSNHEDLNLMPEFDTQNAI